VYGPGIEDAGFGPDVPCAGGCFESPVCCCCKYGDGTSGGKFGFCGEVGSVCERLDPGFFIVDPGTEGWVEPPVCCCCRYGDGTSAGKFGFCGEVGSVDGELLDGVVPDSGIGCIIGGVPLLPDPDMEPEWL